MGTGCLFCSLLLPQSSQHHFVDGFVAAEEVAEIWVIFVVFSEHRQRNGGGGGDRAGYGMWGGSECSLYSLMLHKYRDLSDLFLFLN